jgi:hypothetical protein
MRSNNLVGREGTRKVFVEEIKAFLGEVLIPGYVSIWGAHGVGKSEAVKCAVAEAEELTFPRKIITQLVDYDYKSLNPERVAYSIAAELGAKKPRFFKGASQFNENGEKDWELVVDWIDKTLTSHSRGVASVVIWLSVSELDASHATLARLFKGTLGRTATRKLILEQQRAHNVQLRASEPFYGKGWKLAALSEDEAAELLQNLLNQIVVDPAVLETARTRIRSMCGTHPGLIALVCKQLESKKTAGGTYRNAQDVVKTLSDMISESYELYFLPDVKLFVESLSDSARDRLSDLVRGWHVDIPDEIRDTGVLIADGRVAELIERFLKTPQGVVFISYNHESKPEADRVTEALRQRNVDVWIDSSGLRGGVSWINELDNAISSASSTVVLISSPELGYWQGKEVQASLTKKKFVIPVLLPNGPEPDQLPLFMNTFHCLDFRGGLSKDAFDSLERAVRDVKPRKE